MVAKCEACNIRTNPRRMELHHKHCMKFKRLQAAGRLPSQLAGNGKEKKTEKELVIEKRIAKKLLAVEKKATKKKLAAEKKAAKKLLAEEKKKSKKEK